MKFQHKTLTFFFCCIGMILLSACSHRPTAFDLHGKRGALQARGYYIIQPGDTLFGIAWKHGLDVDDLAQWNHIDDPDRIYAGNKLNLEPPIGYKPAQIITPAVTQFGESGWQWPTHGSVSRDYDPNQPGLKGILIAGRKGQAIYAASNGKVVYNGTGISGFGRLIIIRHADKVFSAYGYLGKSNISEKQSVQKGQLIATMGISPQNRAALYFEIRKHATSVNPYAYIGTRQK